MHQLEEGLLRSCERTVRKAKDIVLFRIPAHAIRQYVPFPDAHLGGIDREPQAFLAAAQQAFPAVRLSANALPADQDDAADCAKIWEVWANDLRERKSPLAKPRPSNHQRRFRPRNPAPREPFGATPPR